MRLRLAVVDDLAQSVKVDAGQARATSTARESFPARGALDEVGIPVDAAGCTARCSASTRFCRLFCRCREGFRSGGAGGCTSRRTVCRTRGRADVLEAVGELGPVLQRLEVRLGVGVICRGVLLARSGLGDVAGREALSRVRAHVLPAARGPSRWGAGAPQAAHTPGLYQATSHSRRAKRSCAREQCNRPASRAVHHPCTVDNSTSI